MKELVLLIGAEDAETKNVRRALAARGAEVVQLGPEDRLTVELEDDGAVRWSFNGVTLLLKKNEFQSGPGLCSVRSFFVRLLSYAPPFPAGSDRFDAEAMVRAAFYDSEALSLRMALLHTLELASAAAFNSVRHESVEWKANRLLALHAAGFPVPPSIMTSSLDAALRFHARWPVTIAKPLQRSLAVHTVDEAQLVRTGEAGLARSPVLFQAFAHGDNVRAFVVDGELVLSVKIAAANAIDFRGSETSYEVLHPSAAFRSRLEAAARLCETRFTAIDLRYRSESDFSILELNNCPSFVTVDGLFDGVVSQALAQALCR